MKQKFAQAFMDTAHVWSKLSYCTRRQVGCVIVDPSFDDNQHNIVGIGYNGTPPGDENVCEHTDTGLTKSSVIHAEINAIDKLQNNDVDMTGVILFVTTAPCLPCAEEIEMSGISHVYYSEVYHTEQGLDYLRSNGITVTQID